MNADQALDLLNALGEGAEEAGAGAPGEGDLWSSLGEALDAASGALGFIAEHWLALALTGEMVGAVLAFKFRHYYGGAVRLLAALATVWAGAFRCRRRSEGGAVGEGSPRRPRSPRRHTGCSCSAGGRRPGTRKTPSCISRPRP